MASQGLVTGRSSLLGSQIKPTLRTNRRRSCKTATTADFTVRPYTVRKGDTLVSIAKKRDVELDQLVRLNQKVNPDRLVEGQTLLIPAGKLSTRDKEILAGISNLNYRSYPVRAGENLQDIISKRNIARSEVEALNPGINLDKLQASQVIKLPANRYTTREKEMLSNVVPAEFFSTDALLNKNTIFAAALLLGGAAYLWTKGKESDDDSEAVEVVLSKQQVQAIKEVLEDDTKK